MTNRHNLPDASTNFANSLTEKETFAVTQKEETVKKGQSIGHKEIAR